MTTNTPTRRIIVGVDPSANAARAAEWAAQEAASRGGVPLHLVHGLNRPHGTSLVDPADSVRNVHEVAADLLARVAAGLRARYPNLTVTTEVSELGGAEALVGLSRQAALAVTGTRGHGGFAGMLLGSVSRALATHADGPLVVVRGPEPEQANGAVVLGVGPNPAASAVEFAFAAARRYGAPLRVLRAWMPPMPMAGFGMPGGTGLGGPGILSTPESFDSDTEEAADATRAIEPVSARYPEVKVEVGAAMGNAVPVLTEAGADARLIVVGAHRHRGPFSVGAGYVVEGLLAHSPVPVAVIPVRAGRDEADGRLEG